jgi:biotin-(acetyl-CoA carboxylase) ligase
VADSLAPDAVKPLLHGGFGRVYRYAELCPSTQRMLADDDAGGALGIGVNANQTAPQLPADADTTPTSLLLETGAPVDRARLLSAILLRLERAYEAWVATGSAGSG